MKLPIHSLATRLCMDAVVALHLSLGRDAWEEPIPARCSVAISSAAPSPLADDHKERSSVRSAGSELDCHHL